MVEYIGIRSTSKEKKEYREYARVLGTSMSKFIRTAVNAYIKGGAKDE